VAGTLQFGDFELDVTAYELRRLGRPVRVERIPMELLILLLERRGDLVSREEIVERLWGKETFVDAETGVNTAIRKVRQALKDSTARPVFIQTITGKGYRFLAPARSKVSLSQDRASLEEGPIQPLIIPSTASIFVKNGANETASKLVANATGAEIAPKHSSSRRNGTIWAISAAGLLLMLAMYLSRGSLPSSHSAGPAVTIALLPFENLTGHADQEYFADGLTEETIAVLGNLNPKRITVIARTSTMAYKRRTKAVGQIGQELGADYLLEGSVRRDESRVRVTVQLIRVRDQSRIWSESFDRFGSAVIQIQDELGNAIARQIQGKLSPGEMAPRQQTRILEAYDPYLLGRHFWNQLRPNTIRKSIEYFQAAVAKDPSYALAFAGLADAYTILPITSDAAPREMWPLARKAALEAVRLNGSLSEAQSAAGEVDFWLEWNWDRAAQRFRRAIQLNASNATAHSRYGQVLSNSGRPNEAVEEIGIARKLDPLSPITNTLTGQFLFYAGRYDEARDALQKGFAIDPDFWVAHLTMGQIHERGGRSAAAIEEFDKAYEFSGGNTLALALKGYVLARSGKHSDAQRIVSDLIQTGQSRFVPPSNVALVYAGLGNRESALEWLDKAYEARDVHLVFLTVDPMWNDLRSQPRFKELLRRCRFVP
jgi:TolB-like protein/DNA-binding winged helix-turn-helix (wHTH) protein/Flp pilus assembly protein TadD